MRTKRDHYVLDDAEVKWHYEFLRGWLLNLGYDAAPLKMPTIKILVLPRKKFKRFIQTYKANVPLWPLAQLEEYGQVRPPETSAGITLGPYGKPPGVYMIAMRKETCTKPLIGHEMLHVFESQLNLKHGTLEQHFNKIAMELDKRDDK
jgi:hypothetical protein